MDNPSSSIVYRSRNLRGMPLWSHCICQRFLNFWLSIPISSKVTSCEVVYCDLSSDQACQFAVFWVLLMAPWISWFLGLWWAIYCRMQCLIPRIQIYKMVSSVSTFSVPKSQNYTDGDFTVLSRKTCSGLPRLVFRYGTVFWEEQFKKYSVKWPLYTLYLLDLEVLSNLRSTPFPSHGIS